MYRFTYFPRVLFNYRAQASTIFTLCIVCLAIHWLSTPARILPNRARSLRGGADTAIKGRGKLQGDLLPPSPFRTAEYVSLGHCVT